MNKRLYWILPPLFILLIAFLPLILSSSLGKAFFTRQISTRLGGGSATIDRISLSWKGPQQFTGIAFDGPHTVGTVQSFTSNVPFWSLSRMGKSFQLQGGTFAFPAYGGGKVNSVKARLEKSTIEATGSTPQGGHLLITGKTESKHDFDVHADLKAIPTGAIDQALKADGKLYQLLGSTADLKGHLVNLAGEGTLKMDLSSTNVQTSLNARFNENELTLQEPLTATFRITKEMGKRYLKSQGSSLIEGIESKTPAILHISSKNFRLPLPFTLDALQIGSATFDLGQMQVQVGKELQNLLQLLKKPGSNPSIEIWFTPVAFQIERGLLQLGRVDALLARSIHLAAWGDANLVKDKLAMFIGLPSDTLEKAFGLKNLPKNYVLKLPVRGSIQSPDIDTQDASSKITAMAIAQKVPTPGGKGGKLFGGLLNLATKPKEDPDVPPPNRPFPWEK